MEANAVRMNRIFIKLDLFHPASNPKTSSVVPWQLAFACKPMGGICDPISSGRPNPMPGA